MENIAEYIQRKTWWTFFYEGGNFEKKKHYLLGFKPVNKKSVNIKRLGKLTRTTIC